jgi:beta-phosphoglucomutase
METVNLLILDYDGTLADCKELHQQAFRKACMKVNNAIRYTDEEVEGMPTFVKIDYLKAKGYQFDETLLMDLKQEYTMNDLSKYVRFDQELKDIFVRLNEKYKLAVCSNATRKFVDKSLAIQKLDMFDPVCTATEHRAKPEVDMYFYAMYHYGVSPMQTVIFEDSPLGIQAATATTANVKQVSNVEHLKGLLNEY